MKILQVIDTLGIGGGERVMVDVTNLLHDRGIFVSVLTIVKEGPLAQYLDSSIKRIALNRKSKWSLIKMYELHTIARDYDIIHTHLRYNFRYVSMVKKLFFGKYEILFHDHFGDIEKDKSIPFLIKQLAQQAWFVGVCQALSDWAVNQLELVQDKVFCIPNIAVKQKHLSDNLIRNKSRSNSIRVMITSNFRASKNLYFALDIIQALTTRMNIQADFYGQIQDVEYFEEFKYKLKSLGLDTATSIVTDCSNIQPLISRYDMALHTATMESGPLVLIEYLCNGLPFLSYQTGEVARQISSRIPIFFMGDFAIENWVNRVEEIMKIQQSDLARSMDECYVDFFSEESYYTKWLELYNRMLENKQ